MDRHLAQAGNGAPQVHGERHHHGALRQMLLVLASHMPTRSGGGARRMIRSSNIGSPFQNNLLVGHGQAEGSFSCF
jgi:hypothetical protein